MSHFPLILFAGIIALSFPSAGTFGDAAPPPTAQSRPPGSKAAEHQEYRDRTAYLQNWHSDLQDLAKLIKEQLEQSEALKSGPDLGKQQNGPVPGDAELQRQASGLHSELQALIPRLNQQLQLEMQSPTVPDPEEQQQRQAVLKALRDVIAEFQQDDDKLRGLTAQHQERIAPSDAPPASAIGEKHAADIGETQAARDALEQQIADLQHQKADLQRQNDELRGQLAEQKNVQRNADAARDKEERLRQADLQRQNDELRGQLAEQKNVQRNADAARDKEERLHQADLQRQNDELRGQLAEQKNVQRNADAARDKEERLRQADLQRQNDELRGQLAEQTNSQAIQELQRNAAERLRQDIDRLASLARQNAAGSSRSKGP